MAEWARDAIEQVGDGHFFVVDRDRAGFDLGEIEDIADEIEQIGAGAVDGAGELHLFVRQIAARIFAELLTQNEDAVERRPQFVRHVCKELGLEFRSERQLAGLFFQRAAGLLYFLILAFDFGVLFRQLLRLLLQLIVGLLQLRLLRLQLGGKILRLFQQAFGLHRRFDGIQHDADTRRQLLEEGLCSVVNDDTDASSITAFT